MSLTLAGTWVNATYYELVHKAEMADLERENAAG
jgi:hypothetical protein